MITDKDREAAVRALWGDVLYGQPPAELASAPDVQPIAQAIAQARAEGRADERERIEKAFDVWLSWVPTKEQVEHRNAIGLTGYIERGGRPEDFKAAIRARGEKGKD